LRSDRDPLILFQTPLDGQGLVFYPASMKSVRKKFSLHLPDRTLHLGERTLVMGILNVTPDSFSDGGRYLDVDRAVERAVEMQCQGADLIDIGAESTRPGSKRVPYEEELHRLVPVLERLREKISIPLSIDTYKSEVAARALKLGASLINDVSAGRWDRDMFELVRRWRVPIILMHMRGTPETWKRLSPRRAVVQSVLREMLLRCRQAQESGLTRRQIIVDPGIGFGKNPSENVRLLGHLEELDVLGFPLCVGTSRKSFLTTVLRCPEGARWAGTAATVAIAALKGAHIVRVHDVAVAVEFVRVADAVREGRIGI
jgi:dihydropteroate synthase